MRQSLLAMQTETPSSQSRLKTTHAKPTQMSALVVHAADAVVAEMVGMTIMVRVLRALVITLLRSSRKALPHVVLMMPKRLNLRQ
jgi:hypothetical protein